MELAATLTASIAGFLCDAWTRLATLAPILLGIFGRSFCIIPDVFVPVVGLIPDFVVGPPCLIISVGLLILLTGHGRGRRVTNLRRVSEHAGQECPDLLGPREVTVDTKTEVEELPLSELNTT